MERHACIAGLCIVIFITFFRFAESGFCEEDYTAAKTCYRQSCHTSSWWRRRCSTHAYTCYETRQRQVCCEGYNGTDCNQDIDECTSGEAECSQHCENNPGSFNCSCFEGYRLSFDGKTCDDIDECTEDKHQCNQTCQNIRGSYTCECVDGYTLGYDGLSCDAICYGSTDCPNGGFCKEPDVCVCLPGYSTPMCDDIDECTSGDAECSQHCENNVGSFMCSCSEGYQLSFDGKTCDDIDECAEDTHQCNQTCQNIQGSYSCECVDGYTLGYDELSCDDTQPPVMSGCPANISLNATNTTLFYHWTPPTFEDPFGNDLDLTQNYPTPSYDFPWGDFTVQYTATKVNNGLSTACIFTVRIRPNPCDDLNIPVNGARICNNWQTEYGRFCLVACNNNYMLDPAYDFQMIYVCGASGNWLATESVPDCDIQIESLDDTLSFHPEYLKHSYASTFCTNTTTTQQLQELFIEQLSGSDAQFDIFCNSFRDECVPANVEVVCS